MSYLHHVDRTDRDSKIGLTRSAGQSANPEVGEDDEGQCECLFGSDTKSASANDLNDAFDKVVIDSGTGTPVKSNARTFGLKARLNKDDDGHIECGAVQSSDGSAAGAYDTLDEWFAKEA